MTTYYYKDFTEEQLERGEAHLMTEETLIADDEDYDITDEYREAGIALEKDCEAFDRTWYTYTDEAGDKRYVVVREKVEG